MSQFDRERQRIQRDYQKHQSQLEQQRRDAQARVSGAAREELSELERRRQELLGEARTLEQRRERAMAIGRRIPLQPITEEKARIEAEAQKIEADIARAKQKADAEITKAVDEPREELETWRDTAMQELDTAEVEFRAQNVELGTGEWVPRDDFKELSQEHQDKLKSLGVEKFNQAMAQEQKVAEAIAQESDVAFKEFKATHVQLDSGEWVTRAEFEELAPQQQLLLKKEGTEKFMQEIESQFKVDHVEVQTGVWYAKSDWEKLTDTQQKELLETGKYTVMLGPREQFDLMAVRGELPEGAYYQGPAVEGAPAQGFKYRTVRISAETLELPGQFIPDSATVTDLARMTGLTEQEVEAKLAIREKAIEDGVKPTTIAPADSELEKLSPMLMGAVAVGTGLSIPTDPITQIAGAIVLAVSAVAIAHQVKDVNWGQLTSEIRDRMESITSVQSKAGADVPQTVVRTDAATGTIEITPAQTAVGGQIQTFTLNPTQMGDIYLPTPLEQMTLADVMLPTPLIQTKAGDVFLPTPLIQQTVADIQTQLPLIQRRLEETYTQVPLIQQKLEDTMTKAVMTSSAAGAAYGAIPNLGPHLTATEMKRLTGIREQYHSAIREALQTGDAEGLRTHMSDARFAIHMILDKLLEEGRIDRGQHALLLRQVQTWERSEEEMLVWLSAYFGSASGTQKMLEESAPKGYPPEQQKQYAAAVLTLLTALWGMPKAKAGATVSEYASTFADPVTGTDAAKTVIEVATPVTSPAAIEQAVTQSLASVATQAATASMTESLTQGLTSTEALAKAQAAAQAAAVKAASATATVTATMSDTAVRSATASAVATAVRTATAIMALRATAKTPILDRKKRPKHKKERKAYPAGTIAWKQGAFWKIIPPPYDLKKPIHSTVPPKGVARLSGTPQETLTFIKGKLPFGNVSFDLGVVDGFIDVKKKTINFTGGGLETVVGRRKPEPTRGLSLVKVRPRKTIRKRKRVPTNKAQRRKIDKAASAL